MSYSKAIIVGRIGKDPEAKVAGELSIVNFSVAVNRKVKNEKVTDWFDVTCFGKNAEMVSEYFKKGSMILVEGSLQVDKWEKDGVKQSKTKVIMDRFAFIDKKDSDSEQSEPPPEKVKSDLPF